MFDDQIFSYDSEGVVKAKGRIESLPLQKEI
jgi:hypothetical protein